MRRAQQVFSGLDLRGDGLGRRRERGVCRSERTHEVSKYDGMARSDSGGSSVSPRLNGSICLMYRARAAGGGWRRPSRGTGESSAGRDERIASRAAAGCLDPRSGLPGRSRRDALRDRWSRSARPERSTLARSRARPLRIRTNSFESRRSPPATWHSSGDRCAPGLEGSGSKPGGPSCERCHHDGPLRFHRIEGPGHPDYEGRHPGLLPRPARSSSSSGFPAWKADLLFCRRKICA
jgi:hypothetical protein